MTDILSPNALQKQKLSSVQSPTGGFFLGSNDDHLERAQARAARAAANRRKPVGSGTSLPHGNSHPGLDKQQILDLFQNCIKLASENKINQKNTWELNLIDHLYEIIEVEEKDTETNFQKASCTLEAGVKIYSLRVDSTHSEAYKVLGGINRAGKENETDTTVVDANVEDKDGEQSSRKEIEKKLSPLSTLEATYESLNVKKFDVAFTVDPLYHQTTAQFDEGGAKGLLLNNLGVYGHCQVLFDSEELPSSCMASLQPDAPDVIDLSFATDYVEIMVQKMRTKDEITPTLKNIVNLFDGVNKRPLDASSSSSFEPVCDQISRDDDASDDEADYGGGDEFQSCVVDEDAADQHGCRENFSADHGENGPFSYRKSDTEDAVERVERYLFLSLGFSLKQNAWAGPDHWKFRKAKENPSVVENALGVTKKVKLKKKQPELELDFTTSSTLDEGEVDVFALPKNAKSLLLPATRAPSNIRLPEDCHYQPEDLVKLFLRPNTMCLAKRSKKSSSVSDEAARGSDYGEPPSYLGEDDPGDFGSDFDDDANALVSHPREVSKIEVQYDGACKQVDVHLLKETLWLHLRDSANRSLRGLRKEGEEVSFRDLLFRFPVCCRAAASIQDVSPHLCFICLLHLANEHGLGIHGCPQLDDLCIRLPYSINNGD